MDVADARCVGACIEAGEDKKMVVSRGRAAGGCDARDAGDARHTSVDAEAEEVVEEEEAVEDVVVGMDEDDDEDKDEDKDDEVVVVLSRA